MFAALLIAAGMSLASGARQPKNLDQRLALIEVKQILQSQQLWGMQTHLTPDAMRALEDLQTHLLRDAEQEDRLRLLTAEVAALAQRTATLELLLQGRLPESNVIPVAPEAAPARAKPSAKRARRSRAHKAFASNE